MLRYAPSALEAFETCLTWPRFEEELTSINTDTSMNIRDMAAKKQKNARKQNLSILTFI